LKTIAETYAAAMPEIPAAVMPTTHTRATA
jgi:hypothetical protein